MRDIVFDTFTKSYWEYGDDFGDEIKAQICCGKCGAKQPIYLHEETDFVEDLVFDCCECGERNVLRCY